MKINEREVEHEISEIFPKRWSPRAFNNKDMPKEDLMKLFEAARWAPSSYNKQPWFFIYAFRGTEQWDRLYDLMVDFNKSWAKNASALIVVFSRLTDEEERPNPMHSFDAGSAWMSLALQADHLGMHVHAMSGFDKERAIEDLEAPDYYQPEAMIAVGYKANKDTLPESLRENESPSGRKKIEEFIKEGSF